MCNDINSTFLHTHTHTHTHTHNDLFKNNDKNHNDMQICVVLFYRSISDYIIRTRSEYIIRINPGVFLGKNRARENSIGWKN